MGDGVAGAVERVCDDLIGPAALAVDADVVPRSHLDALAATGVFGQAVIDGDPPERVRRAHERLAGACLATWLVVAQHQLPFRLVDAAVEPLRSALLPLLASGTSIAGVSFSHLRRLPHRQVQVERLSGGWVFDGEAPWYTGWGINDVAVLAGATVDGDVVFALVPAEPSPGMVPGDPVRTVSMGATRTVSLRLSQLVVPDAGVLCVVPSDEWRAKDQATSANVSPAVIGVTQAALDRLAKGPDDVGRSLATTLAQRLTSLRAHAYELIDHNPPGDYRDLRLRLRAEALTLCRDATAALVMARGGRALTRTDDAQLLDRWAQFLTVQAQTRELRRVQLDAMRDRWRGA